MEKYLCDGYKTVALIGSFRNHYDLMTLLMADCVYVCNKDSYIGGTIS